jgi:glycosyltransferase involved in cell wall biosynthesis
LPTNRKAPTRPRWFVRTGFWRRTGFLTRTYDEFADRIADLVREPALRARLAGTGIATLARFGWDVVTEQYLDVYRRAMVTSQARGRCGLR